MKKRFNALSFYMILVILCSLVGVLTPSGSGIARLIQTLFIAVSLFYAIKANVSYKVPILFKALNLLIALLTAYGVIFLFGGGGTYHGLYVTGTYYLFGIFTSLLPVYAFFVFAKEGLLEDASSKVCFFVFFVLAVITYYQTQSNQLRYIQELGSAYDEVTNNAGYAFVGLLPAIVLFCEKPMKQYLLLVFCGLFIIASMKRGAILAFVLVLSWFLTKSVKTAKRMKWFYITITVAVVAAGFYFVNYMIDNSVYFNARINDTLEGNDSGRTELLTSSLKYFWEETSLSRFVFGHGANGTVVKFGQYAHNDWLEIAINQGLLGLIIYFIYWLNYYKTWRGVKWDQERFICMGMLFIIYFSETFFTMSYAGVSRCSAMMLGYCLAGEYPNLRQNN